MSSLEQARSYFAEQSREIGRNRLQMQKMTDALVEVKDGPFVGLPEDILAWVRKVKLLAVEALKPATPYERNLGLLSRALWGATTKGLPWGRLWIDVDIDKPDGTTERRKVYAASQVKTAIARHPTGHAFGVLALAETMPGVPNVAAYRSFSPRELDELIRALEDMKAEIINHNGPLIEPAPWDA